MRLRLFCVLAASVAAAPALADPPSEPRKPNQFVIISFDGAHELAQWKRSSALAKRTGARFTYFLSCVFLLSPETKAAYQPPGMKAGRSNVGFGYSPGDVEQRLYQIRLATRQGHEIASHGCGHFDGRNWSAADWRQEFQQFETILRDAYRINGLPHEPADWRSIADSVVGFRAPYLATGKPLFDTLDGEGFAYDASGVSRGPAAAGQGAVQRFALPMIPEGPKASPVIAMDYNLYARHSRARELPARSKEFEERSYRAFKAAFEREYAGERAPLQLGFHFTLMNDGAYWRALERFAAEVCSKPDVACISYRDYLARQGKPARQVGG